MTQIHSHHPVRILAITVLSFLLTTVATQAKTTETISESFEASPGDTLVVDVHGAQIEVTGQAGSTVRIEVERTVNGASKEKEEAALQASPVTIEQSGNTISIHQPKVEGTGSESFFGWFGKKGMKTDFKYTVVLPSDFNANLQTSGGNISATHLNGDVQAKTSGGKVHADDLSGVIDINTSGGSINLSKCHGETTAETSGGSIESANGSGNLKLDTSGGAIRVKGHAGNINAHTSGGSINASMLEPPSADCSLSTSGGSITVNLPESTAVDLSASTSGGRVSSDFEVAGSNPDKKNKLQGAINGGGPSLHLHTSGGNIRINKESGA